DAIQQFPKNINVSIILSMAGVGLEKTNVKIIADPEMTKNRHEIKISGTFGEATFAVTNEPLVMNPKTSYLAALSVLGTLDRFPLSIKVGHLFIILKYVGNLVSYDRYFHSTI